MSVLPSDDPVVGASTVTASAPPVREPGLRSRAGNAMGRTRTAVLDGAARAVAAGGARKTTMADIAAAAGIAKGTLYNHFRTKEAVFAAALESGIAELADDAAKSAADSGLAAGLSLAAASLSDSPALTRLRAEPAALLPLVSVGDSGLWTCAREGVARVLAAGGGRCDGVATDLVLRWLVSFAAAAAGDADGSAHVVAACLTPPPD